MDLSALKGAQDKPEPPRDGERAAPAAESVAAAAEAPAREEKPAAAAETSDTAAGSAAKETPGGTPEPVN